MNWDFLPYSADTKFSESPTSYPFTIPLSTSVEARTFFNDMLLSFSIWVFFHEQSRFTGQQGKEEAISLIPLYHFHPLPRHLDIS